VSDRGSGFVQRTQVAVGVGTIARLPAELDRLGVIRPVVLCDAALVEGPVGARIRTLLPHATIVGRAGGEPSFDSIRDDARQIELAEADGLVAVGGGSTIDTAKLGRGLLAARVSDLAMLPDPLPSRPLPFIAVPTTAGTGAEIGSGAIAFDPRVDDKILVRRPELVADLAIADAELTLSLPANLTAWTGCDALGQALLAYVPAGWDSVAGQLALRAIKLIVDALPRAVADGQDLDARRDQMLGSVLSALAMFNAPPTYAGEHTFAEPVGAALHIHHGMAVAQFLAGTVELNAEVASDRFAEVARELGLADQTVPPMEATLVLAARLRALVDEFGIPALRDVAPDADLNVLAARCARHDGYLLNPRPLDDAATLAVLEGAWTGTWRANIRAAV